MGQHPDRGTPDGSARPAREPAGRGRGLEPRPAGEAPQQPSAQPPAPASQPPLASIPAGTDVQGIDLALDVMEIGVFEWDVVSGQHRFSDRCKTIWGFCAGEEMSAEMILGRIHPDDLHLSSLVFNAIAPGGPGRYSVEHRIVMPDQSIRWVQVAGRVDHASATGGAGPVRGYGSMRDVTARRLAEQQLYERTSQLRAFVEGAPVPIAVFDRGMRYLMVSGLYAQERQVDPADLIGRCVYEVFPALPPHWLARHRRVLAGLTEKCESEPWVQPGGRQEWIRWEMRPWHRADNEVGGVILFAEFITGSIQAQQELRDSQARLELALRAGALGVYEYDFDTRQANWDARLRRLWGFGPDEPVTGERVAASIPAEDRERVQRELQEALAPGGSGIFATEHRIIRPVDGSVRWVAVTGRVSHEDHVRIIGVSQDITERKNTEMALEQTAAELRRADERKNVYLATLSHELRNPLAPIRTAAHLLTSPKLTGEQLQWVAQVIRRQSGHMASLLDDLLEITRISRGKLVLRRQTVPLADIVQSAVESARPLIDERHHELRVSLPPDTEAAGGASAPSLPEPPPPSHPFLITADPLRLSQVLSNLLTNAAKYTDPGGWIELAAAVEDGQLVIRVRDNGIGIPPELIGKVFTLFWQADSLCAHSQGGLGIGLAFAEGIMQLHGGTIEARSAGTGRGSEFVLHLPLTGAGPAVPPAPAGLSAAVPPPHRRILVADDDRDTADTLQMLLTLSSHEVRVAHGGREALAAARDFRPDVALLDLSMPGLDGYGVARLLRQEPWARGLRLIALTGLGQPDDRRRASEAGFDEQLIKPIDPDKLRSLLARPSWIDQVSPAH